jgi:hypothetical protein
MDKNLIKTITLEITNNNLVKTITLEITAQIDKAATKNGNPAKQFANLVAQNGNIKYHTYNIHSQIPFEAVKQH